MGFRVKRARPLHPNHPPPYPAQHSTHPTPHPPHTSALFLFVPKKFHLFFLFHHIKRKMRSFLLVCQKDISIKSLISPLLPSEDRQVHQVSFVLLVCCIQILLCVLPATVRKRLQRSVSLGLSSENIMCRVDIYIFLAFFVPKAKDPKTHVTPIRYLLTQTRVVPSTC